MREAWEKFQEMKVKDVIADEALFRELKERFGSPYGWGEYFRGGMGAESVRDLLEQVDLEGEAPSWSTSSAAPRARSRTRRSSA